jgi:sterol desaturase/sphingolipid hydroxylase (fatty acid hydroxylase superfamily)
MNIINNLLLYFLIYIVIFCIIVKLNSYHKNHYKCDLVYYNNIFINYSFIFIITIFAINYISDYECSILINPLKIIIYFLIVDSFLYWYHRSIHRQPFLKKYIHETHHNNYHMVPLDAITVSFLEILCNFLFIFLIPTYLTQINLFESIIIYGIIVSHISYIHMDVNYNYFFNFFINSKYHAKHHKIGGGNYGQFFYIWDYLMNTIINCDKKLSRKKSKKKIKNKSNDKNK